jgi:hypothetical protein
MFHGCAPEYLCNLVPPQPHDLHNNNTRRASNTQIVYSRTSFYRNSFLPLAVCEWNNLPIEVGRNSSKYTLKRFLNRNAVKIPSYFNTGSRRGQVLHARLRLSCSNLNDHLYRRNITDSSLWHCGYVESTSHLPLECHLYNDTRVRTIVHLGRNIPIDTHLFGDEILIFEDNKRTFETYLCFALSYYINLHIS